MVRTQAANMGSSPPSSTEATHFGTPSTNITAMSPEACTSLNTPGVTPRFGLSINTNQARAVPRANNVSNLRLPTSGRVQLSPTAEEFTPRSATFNFNAATYGLNTSPVRNLVAGSMPDVHTNAQPTVHGAIGQGTRVTTVTDLNSTFQLGPHLQVAWGKFSNDENVTRTFQIFDKHHVPSLYHILNTFPDRFTSLATIDNRHLQSGIIRLTFNDDRQAKQAYVLAASLTHPHCELTQLTPKDLAIAHGRDPSSVSNYEGQILVTVMYHPQSVMPTVQQLYEKLTFFGPVKAIVSTTPVIMNSVSFRVEYHHTEHASNASECLLQASTANVRYMSAPYEPDTFSQQSATMPPPGFSQGSNAQPSLTGRSTIAPRDLARLENVMARVMRENPMSYRGFPRSGHNVVDIGRIEAGLDVRTTIMLRNIPNKVDQPTLKNLLDVTSLGDYDFMYLRIDFANNCNVGYAFINFVDPLAIIPFARARAGKRWNIFSSDKVAEISYATIQGRDCLVQKFRNSSVMLEDPLYRPKLYYARPSMLAGQEEDFEEPDNYSKMRRSLDNAEHIGLYHHGNRRRAAAPARVSTRRSARTPARRSTRNFTRNFTRAQNSPARTVSSASKSWSSTTTRSSTNSGLFAPREGQAHREEQRRRRSQFDRGTPGAEIELSSYRLTDAAFERPRMNDARGFTAAFNGLRL